MKSTPELDKHRLIDKLRRFIVHLIQFRRNLWMNPDTLY